MADKYIPFKDLNRNENNNTGRKQQLFNCLFQLLPLRKIIIARAS